AGRANTCVAQGIIRNFQKMSLLRIDLFGLTRTHAERCRIETPDVVDHAGCKRVAAPLLADRGMMIGVSGEAVGCNPSDAATVLFEQVPERFAVARPWHAARVPDDGDFAY